MQSALEQWIPHREEFADELFKLEALYLGDKPAPCQICSSDIAPFRCLDCFSFGPACEDCVLRQHEHHIFHRIQVGTLFLCAAAGVNALQRWNGSFFHDTSLFHLGASYQLSHDVGDRCDNPSRPLDLMLFDVSGVHTVQVSYCFCNENSVPRHCQLLRQRWFPATWARPSTAFTFRLLNFLHKLQTQSKVNLYDFYHSLISVTDSAGQTPPVVNLSHSLF